MCADAVDHLREAAPYDLIHSVSGVPFLNPHRNPHCLLPAMATGIKPVAARPEILRLPGTDIEHQMHMRVLAPQLREDLLVDHGLGMETIRTIDSPQVDQPLSYRLRTATSGSSPGPRPARGPQSTPPDHLRVGLVVSTGSV
ncbi:hypothetical protein [Streptomyces sp. NPDC002394]